MQGSEQQQRLKIIYKMLFELAIGNLKFRIELRGEDSAVEKIARMLNGIAAELEKIEQPSQFTSLLVHNNPLESEAAIIKQVHEYILNHLDEPLISIKQLSVHFKINEFKLKTGFREQYNTSIYQFYNDERLLRAKKLIETTGISLKKIAFICGFNSYLNFYKAFKKKFGCAPGEITRPTIGE